jgi:hypothetical protein
MREKSAESAEGAMIGILIGPSYLGGAPLVKNRINEIMEKIFLPECHYLCKP